MNGSLTVNQWLQLKHLESADFRDDWSLQAHNNKSNGLILAPMHQQVHYFTENRFITE